MRPKNKQVTIGTDTLLKILMKIRGPNEPCKICESGLCVVCKAYTIVSRKDQKLIDYTIEGKQIFDAKW